MKAYTAAPPDVLRVDEKHLREHSVLNCCGVLSRRTTRPMAFICRPMTAVISSHGPISQRKNSHRLTGTACGHGMAATGSPTSRPISTNSIFRRSTRKRRRQRHPAFLDIVDANRAPEDAELADVLDEMGNPDATTLIRITDAAAGEIQAWLRDRKNRRAIPHRLEKCGYVPVRNGDAKDGFWKIRGARQVVYGKSAASISDRFRAARKLTEDR